MKKRPVVVVTRRLPDVIETRMRELFDARLNLDDRPLSRDELLEAMRQADVLVPTVTDEIDAGLLGEAGPGLRLVANFGNGVDNIDVPAAHQKGITVTNTPGVLTEDTADMTMALILAVARRIPEGAAVIPRGRMDRLVAHLDARPAHHRQAPRHRRHGPHRPRPGAPRPGLRPVDPLPQPAPGAARRGGFPGGDLVGEPRPDARPHGHRVRELPAHARHLPPALGAAPQAPEARRHRGEHGPRRDHRRGGPGPPHRGRRHRRRRASTCSSRSRR